MWTRARSFPSLGVTKVTSYCIAPFIYESSLGSGFAICLPAPPSGFKMDHGGDRGATDSPTVHAAAYSCCCCCMVITASPWITMVLPSREADRYRTIDYSCYSVEVSQTYLAVFEGLMLRHSRLQRWKVRDKLAWSLIHVFQRIQTCGRSRHLRRLRVWCLRIIIDYSGSIKMQGLYSVGGVV